MQKYKIKYKTMKKINNNDFSLKKPNAMSLVSYSRPCKDYITAFVLWSEQFVALGIAIAVDCSHCLKIVPVINYSITPSSRSFNNLIGTSFSSTALSSLVLFMAYITPFHSICGPGSSVNSDDTFYLPFFHSRG